MNSIVKRHHIRFRGIDNNSQFFKLFPNKIQQSNFQDIPMLLRSLVITTLLTCFQHTVIAEDVAVGEESAPSNTFFDGESFNGWTMESGKPVEKGWEIVDGVIHLSKKGGRSGHILTADELGDFNFSFEFKISPRGNSGIKYRVRKYRGRYLGCEYQIFDAGERKTGGLSSTGALYALYAPEGDVPTKKAGEWNSGKIVVKDQAIEHWLNGKKIVSAKVGSEQWQKKIKASKFNDEENFGENELGRIMLTDHGSEVWYRNLKLERLSEETTTESTADATPQ